MRLFVILLISVLLLSCATTNTETLHQQHPLLGRIYQPNQHRFIDESEMTSVIKSSDALFIGEAHDNLEHHQKQAQIIRQFLSKGQSGIVAIEMITNTQFDEIMREKPKDVDHLIQVLNQEEIGWKYETFYKVVFQSIYENGYEMSAGNLNRDWIRNIVRQGESEIPKPIKAIIEHVELGKQNLSNIEKEIEISHCGFMKGEHVAGMVTAQRVRDAYMAGAVAEATTRADKVILLAGSNHVRTDRGVPVYVHYLAPNVKVLTIGLVEVENDKMNPVEYSQHWHVDDLPFDYVWFTTKAERPDRCAELREYMHQSQKGVHKI